MTEPGPPDRRLVAGWWTPSAVLVSRSEYALFMALIKPSNSRPVTTTYVRPATRPQPIARAARWPIQRWSRCAIQWYRPRRPRPISRIRQNTSAATNGEATTSTMLYSVTPISLRIKYCQYCPSPKKTTVRTAALMKKASQDRRRGRRGSRSAKARQIHAPITPSP